MVQFVEIQKLFPMVPNSNQFPGIDRRKSNLQPFCRRLGEHPSANFHMDLTMHKNIPHYWYLIPTA